MLNDAYFAQILQGVPADELLYYVWLTGMYPAREKFSSVTCPLVDLNGKPFSAAQHPAIEIAKELGHSFPDRIDPQRFQFALLHAIPARRLQDFNNRLTTWTHEWMTGSELKCVYPSEFHRYLVAFSDTPGRATEPPARLPLSKSTPS
jgi:hypothetical protein